ncbi:MAG: DNA replication/repair protein RecF [Patescibacteria group bacterium]
MKIQKLQLENFRNYENYFYEFNSEKNFTILVGKNGLGKTNFLEALYVLSLGRSFRTSDFDNLLMWEREFLRCQTEVIDEREEAYKLEFSYSKLPRRKKIFKRNGLNLRSSKYLGNLLTVLFNPEDLNMLYLEPGLRRKYLDIILCQTDFHYLEDLGNYKQALKQRNALIKGFGGGFGEGFGVGGGGVGVRSGGNFEADLQVWDEEMIKYGAPVILKRKKLVEFLNGRVSELYQAIAGGADRVTVEYQSKILKPLSDLSLESQYRDELFNRHHRDLLRRQTTAGPHRDDLKFYINGKDILGSASRGEFRTLLLALKLCEIEYIKSVSGESPILLLDDVFSELDLDRQKFLIESIFSCQTIITTTDLSGLEEILEKSEVVRM